LPPPATVTPIPINNSNTSSAIIRSSSQTNSVESQKPDIEDE
ncbi:unnamed protein product, partial [Rotaria sp. Silwood1]